ncbi:hypothetical protein ABT218_26210 [Streptomyces sp. NPDC001455]|uniref:hypothetical protein n=1 Tax=unclassified Streptomyces TaxID=2593676 RepID=UPI003322FC20
MSHGVLALGVAVICVSGHVWYLPACIDLRAAQDRPESRRPAAAAVLTGWATAGLTMLLLLAPFTPWAAVVVGSAGLSATLTLVVRSWLLRRQEQCEEAARWAALLPVSTAAPARRPDSARRAGPARHSEDDR